MATTMLITGHIKHIDLKRRVALVRQEPSGFEMFVLLDSEESFFVGDKIEVTLATQHGSVSKCR